MRERAKILGHGVLRIGIIKNRVINLIYLFLLATKNKILFWSKKKTHTITSLLGFSFVQDHNLDSKKTVNECLLSLLTRNYACVFREAAKFLFF